MSNLDQSHMVDDGPDRYAVLFFSRAKAAQQMQAGGQRPNMQQVQAMQNAMPPELLRQMRSAGSPQGAQKVMQEYIAKHGEGSIDMQSMMSAMMGGGMPGMPSMPGMPGEWWTRKEAYPGSQLLISTILLADRYEPNDGNAWRRRRRGHAQFERSSWYDGHVIVTRFVDHHVMTRSSHIPFRSITSRTTQ